MWNRRCFFSSQNQNWKTPKEFKKQLDNEFKFDYDPCPYKAKFNGLSRNWKKSNFINPPYNREIKWWLIKSLINGYKSVFLLPVRTDTKWFHELVLPFADEIRFIKGRLKFSNHKNSAPFPSMLVIYKGRKRVLPSKLIKL